MTISEYIQKLESLKNKHGDIRVTTYGFRGVADAIDPELRQIRARRKGESKTYYLNSWDSDPVVENVINI